MKKFLSLLTTLIFISTTSTTVISCNNTVNPTKKKIDLNSKQLDTLTIWVTNNTDTSYSYIYNRIVSNLNQQLGAKFKLKLNEINMESINEQFNSYKSDPNSQATKGDLSNGVTIKVTPKSNLTDNIKGSCTLNVSILNKTSIETLFNNNIMPGIQLKVASNKPKNQAEVDQINQKIKTALFEQLKTKNQYLTKDDINLPALNLVNLNTSFNNTLNISVKPSGTSAILKQDNKNIIFPVYFNKQKINLSSLDWSGTLISTKVDNNKNLLSSKINSIKNDIRQKIQNFLSNEINGIQKQDYIINDINQKIIPNQDLSNGITLNIQGTTTSSLIDTSSKNVNVYFATNVKNINFIINNNSKLNVHNKNILIQDDVTRWKTLVKNTIDNTLKQEVTNNISYSNDYSISNLNKIRVGQNVSRGINLTIIANVNSKYIWGYKQIKLEFENYNKYDLSSISISIYEYRYVLNKADVVSSELQTIKTNLTTYLINKIYDVLKNNPSFNQFTTTQIQNDLDLSPIQNLTVGDYSQSRSLIINSKNTSRFMKNSINLKFELINKNRTDISKINFPNPFKKFRVANTQNVTNNEAQSINSRLKQDILNKLTQENANVTEQDFTTTQITPGNIGPNNTIKTITINSNVRSPNIIGSKNINIQISNYQKINLTNFSFNDLELNVADPQNITDDEITKLKQEIPNMISSQLARNNKNITSNDFTIPNLDTSIVKGMPSQGTVLNVQAKNNNQFLINNGNINIIIKKGPINLSTDNNVKLLLSKIIIQVDNKSNISAATMNDIKNNILPNQIIILLKSISNENITINDIVLENLDNLTPGDWSSKSAKINIKGNPNKKDLITGNFNNMEISFN